MLNLNVSIISRQGNSAPVLKSSNKLSRRLQDYNLIKFLNMTDLILKKSLNLFCKPVTELNSTEVDTESKIVCFVFE